MDCYFHHAVPSIAPCKVCRKPVCATCRTEAGDCPSCRLAARIDAASATQQLRGGVGPSNPGAAYQEPQPPPHWQQWQQQPSQPPRTQPAAAAAAVRPESRALVALGYPFWPLALIALLDSRGSHFVRRQAWQALGFNAAAWCVFVPIISMTLLPFAWLIPLFAFVVSVVYAAKVWGGEDVSVPVVSELVDNRLTA